MSTGPNRKDTVKNANRKTDQDALDKLIRKRARQVGVEGQHYLDWLLMRVSEIANPMLMHTEETAEIEEGKQAQVMFTDNRSFDSHVITIMVTRTEADEYIEPELVLSGGEIPDHVSKH